LENSDGVFEAKFSPYNKIWAYSMVPLHLIVVLVNMRGRYFT
jgi:hypothetical protein